MRDCPETSFRNRGSSQKLWGFLETSLIGETPGAGCRNAVGLVSEPVGFLRNPEVSQKTKTVARNAFCNSFCSDSTASNISNGGVAAINLRSWRRTFGCKIEPPGPNFDSDLIVFCGKAANTQNCREKRFLRQFWLGLNSEQPKYVAVVGPQGPGAQP